MTGLAVDGLFVARERIGLARPEILRRPQERRALGRPACLVALGRLVQRKRGVILDELVDLLFGAASLSHVLRNVVLALVQGFHHFLGGVLRLRFGGAQQWDGGNTCERERDGRSDEVTAGDGSLAHAGLDELLGYLRFQPTQTGES